MSTIFLFCLKKFNWLLFVVLFSYFVSMKANMNLYCFLIVVLLSPVSGSLLNKAFSFSSTYKPNLVRTVEIVDFQRIENVPLSVFKNDSVVIRLNDTKTSLFLVNALNTKHMEMERIVGSPSFPSIGLSTPPLPKQIAGTHTWYEFQTTDVRSVRGGSFPISPCLDSREGDGGGLSDAFILSFGKTAKLDFPYGYKTSYNITLGLEADFEVDAGVDLSVTYSCNVAANSTGQVLLELQYLEFRDPMFRQVDVVESKRWWKRLFSLDIGSWQATQSFRTLNSMVAPVVVCSTDPDVIQCQLPIRMVEDLIYSWL